MRAFEFKQEMRTVQHKTIARQTVADEQTQILAISKTKEQHSAHKKQQMKNILKIYA